jgi:putative transposase
MVVVCVVQLNLQKLNQVHVLRRKPAARTIIGKHFSGGISKRPGMSLFEEGRVTFKYKDSAADEESSARSVRKSSSGGFLQHVLPERFVKVRYYGLLSPGNRHLLKRVREALGARTSGSVASSEGGASNQREPLRCQSCGSEMKLIGTLSGRGREPP